MDIENPKPPLGTFVIALNPGEDCPEGFNIQVSDRNRNFETSITKKRVLSHYGAEMFEKLEKNLS